MFGHIQERRRRGRFLPRGLNKGKGGVALWRLACNVPRPAARDARWMETTRWASFLRDMSQIRYAASPSGRGI